MRISDWSSDVCSSDLLDETEFTPLLAKYNAQGVSIVGMTVTGNVSASNFVKQFRDRRMPALLIGHGLTWFSEWHELTGRSEERSDGKECVRSWRSWWTPLH